MRRLSDIVPRSGNQQPVAIGLAAWIALTGCGSGTLPPPPNVPPPNSTGAAIEITPTPAPATEAAEVATASGPPVFPMLTAINAINANQLGEVAHVEATGARTVSISPTGQALASAEDADNRIVIYEMPYTFSAIVLMGHQGPVNDLTWSPDGQIIASASDDGTARLWDASTGQEKSKIAVDQDGAASVAWSPDGTKIVTGNNHGSAQVWDAQSGDQLMLVQPGADFMSVTALAWSGDSKSFAAATWPGIEGGGAITVYNAATGEQIGGLGDVFSVTPGSLAWAGLASKIGWIKNADGRAMIWDFPDNVEAVALSDPAKAHAVGFSPDGKLVATGADDHKARVWDTATGGLLATLEGHTDIIHTVRWSNDGLYLVTAGLDDVIRVWGVGKQ